MFRKLFWALLAVSVLVATGCATIVSTKTQLVSFQSSPAGATVLIDGRPIGQTPLSLQLERKNNQALVIRKGGYKEFSTTMSTTLNGWFFGNIVLGGLLGSTTDAATGAMHEYAPNQFLVALEPEGSNAATSKTEKSKADKIREFVLLSYNPLSADIKAGSGNYLNSLLNQLEVGTESREQAITRIKGLHQAYPDMQQFADQLIASFQK